MGHRGPLPTKGLPRRKSRQKALDEATTVGSVEVQNEAPWEPGEDWHEIAIEFYQSVERSGQSDLYTESDWAKLYLMCEQMSRELKPIFVGFTDDWKVITVNGVDELVKYQRPISGVQPLKGASLNALQAMAASLGISEGDRRRMNLELRHAPAGEDAAKAAAAEAAADAAFMAALASGEVVQMNPKASGE